MVKERAATVLLNPSTDIPNIPYEIAAKPATQVRISKKKIPISARSANISGIKKP